MDTQLDSLFTILTSIENFEDRYATVIPDARDYVIDAERMGRTTLAEAEKLDLPEEQQGETVAISRLKQGCHLLKP
ncbi:MAG: hypothetical protein F6J86_36825 [Symploca sp. SIO1B1]|nr:hypothetical protein [Symploca sp. SIO1C2]NER99327.1 hypothetical protein [Symploca sp. SIO1B1]